jgi:serine/threonine-protein kinase
MGCLLTTMLQGDPPFDGMAAMDIISKQMFVPPPPLRRHEDDEPIPPLLERLRLSLLAKQPHDRPPDAATIAALLREAVSPEAHAERLPTRKGDVPLGGRDARAPAWQGSERPSHREAPSKLRVAVVSAALHAGGCDEVCSTGLAALGLLVKPTAHVDDVSLDDVDIVVVDAWQSIDTALEALATLARFAPGVGAIVCLDGLTTERMNRLIEAGAADVLRYPISSDKLAKKIQRAARRRS